MGVFEVADYKSDVRIAKFKKAKVYKSATYNFVIHTDIRIAISDPENPGIASFVAIAKTLSIYTNITAIFNLPF